MVDMFKNYPQPDDYIPDNRPKKWEPSFAPIVLGASVTHIFPITEENYINIEVIYKQSVTEVVVKAINIDISSIDTNNSISVSLSPEETALFNKNTHDAFAQLKYTLQSGEVKYSREYRILVLSTLDNPKELY